MSRPRFRLGLTREVSILLPVALLLLVLLSTFTLLAYRDAVATLAAEQAAPPGSALASELGRQELLVRRLTWLVVPVDIALVALVLLYLRQLLAPYAAILERARAVAPPEAADDAAQLVATFERAVAALARSTPGSDEAAIAALESVLGPSLDSGALLVDAERRVLALNPAGAALLGVALDAGERQPLAAALAAAPQLAGLVEEALATGRTARHGELTVGGDRVLGATAHPLRRNDGSVRGALALFVDLTAARQAAERERLAAGLAQLGELAAGLAHELRNGVATLAGYLTLIERRPEEESAADYLTEMRRETEHLMRVLEDFLSFARPERLRLEAVDLAALVARAVRDPALAGVAVEVRAGAAAPAVAGDPHLLERALRNLLHNAAHAHAEAGAREPIEVALARRGSEIEIAIADRGAGLPAGPPERLFEPFVSRRAGGVGLGLPLARHILALHGGDVRLEPRADGPGARAVIVLPIDTIATKSNV